MDKIVRVLLKNKKKTLYQKKLDRSAGWRPSFKKDKIFKKKLR